VLDNILKDLENETLEELLQIKRSLAFCRVCKDGGKFLVLIVLLVMLYIAAY
jgi:hypothetical protein